MPSGFEHTTKIQPMPRRRRLRLPLMPSGFEHTKEEYNEAAALVAETAPYAFGL